MFSNYKGEQVKVPSNEDNYVEVVNPTGERRRVFIGELAKHRMEGFEPVGNLIGEQIVDESIPRAPYQPAQGVTPMAPAMPTPRGGRATPMQVSPGVQGPAAPQSPQLGQSLLDSSPARQLAPEQVDLVKAKVMERTREDAENDYNSGGLLRGIGMAIAGGLEGGGNRTGDISNTLSSFKDIDKKRYDQTMGKFEKDEAAKKLAEKEAFERSLQMSGENRAQKSFEVQQQQAQMMIDAAKADNDPASPKAGYFRALAKSLGHEGDLSKLGAADILKGVDGLEKLAQLKLTAENAQMQNKLGWGQIQAQRDIASGKLAAGSSKSNGKPLEEGAVNKLTEMDADLDLLRSIKKQKAEFNTGPLDSRLKSIASGIGLGSKGWDDFKARVSGQLTKRLHELAGTAQSPQERADILNSIPDFNDPDQKFLEKLDASESILSKKRDIFMNTLKASGRDVSGFANQQPTQQRFAKVRTPRGLVKIPESELTPDDKIEGWL